VFQKQADSKDRKEAELDGKLKTKEAELATKEAELAERDRRIGEMRKEELERTKALESRLADAKATADESAAALNKEKEDVTARLAAKDSEVSDAKEGERTALESVASLRNRVAELEAQEKLYQEKSAQLETLKAEKIRQQEHYESILQVFQKQADSKDRKEAELDGKLKTKEAELATKEAELAERDRRIGEMRKEELERTKALESRLADAKATADESAAALNKEKEDVTARLAAKDSEVSDAKEGERTALESVASLRNRVAELEAQFKEKDEALKKAVLELQREKEAGKRLDDVNDDLKRQIAAERDTMQTFKDLVETLKGELDAMRGQVSKKDSELEEMIGAYKALEEEKAAQQAYYTTTLDEQKAQLSSAEAKLSSAEAQLSSAEAKLSSAEGELSSAGQEESPVAEGGVRCKLDDMSVDDINLPEEINRMLRNLTGDLEKDLPIIEAALKKIGEASNGPRAGGLHVCLFAIAEVCRKYGPMSARVVHLSFYALAKMCFKSRPNRRQVTHFPFRENLSFMVELVGIHKHDPKVQQSAFKLFSVIGLEESIQSFDTKLALGHVMEAMCLHQNDKDAFGLGCHAIASMSANDSTLRAKLLNEDGFTRIFSGLRRFLEDEKCCNAVAQVVYCFCIRMDLGHYKIIENEGVELLIQCIEVHPAHTSLVKFVALVLHQLAFKSPKCNQSVQEILIKRAGIQKTLDASMDLITKEHQKSGRDPVEEVGWAEAEKAIGRFRALFSRQGTAVGR